MNDQSNGERGNRPIETLRDGQLKLAIFRNEVENGFSYAMVPGRIYTDRETGKVHEANSYNGPEGLRIGHLMSRGHDRIREFREQDAKREKEHAKEHAKEQPREQETQDRERTTERER